MYLTKDRIVYYITCYVTCHTGVNWMYILVGTNPHRLPAARSHVLEERCLRPQAQALPNTPFGGGMEL